MGEFCRSEVRHIAASGGAAFIRREVSLGGAALATAIRLTSSATATVMACGLAKTTFNSTARFSRDRTSSDVKVRDVLQCRDWDTMWRTREDVLKRCDARK
jgi:hypothetical protein